MSLGSLRFRGGILNQRGVASERAFVRASGRCDKGATSIDVAPLCISVVLLDVESSKR